MLKTYEDRIFISLTIYIVFGIIIALTHIQIPAVKYPFDTSAYFSDEMAREMCSKNKLEGKLFCLMNEAKKVK